LKPFVAVNEVSIITTPILGKYQVFIEEEPISNQHSQAQVLSLVTTTMAGT
jgi:hypothetical protein